MGIIDVARDTIKNLPVSDVIRERLNLALDQLAEAEKQNGALKKAKGALEAQLDSERRDHDQTRQELQRIKAEHAEDVRIYESVEFRRGERTGGRWAAFCPNCHLPATEFPAIPAMSAPGIVSLPSPLTVQCPTNKCGWRIYPKQTLEQMITALR